MNGVGWFPQEYAHEFFVIKGLLALIATVGIVIHMSRTWNRVESPGRRMRYYSLLYLSALMTASTVEQTKHDTPVFYRNFGVMIGVVLVLAATWVSLREDRGDRPPE